MAAITTGGFDRVIRIGRGLVATSIRRRHGRNSLRGAYLMHYLPCSSRPWTERSHYTHTTAPFVATVRTISFPCFLVSFRSKRISQTGTTTKGTRDKTMNSCYLYCAITVIHIEISIHDTYDEPYTTK